MRTAQHVNMYMYMYSTHVSTAWMVPRSCEKTYKLRANWNMAAGPRSEIFRLNGPQPASPKKFALAGPPRTLSSRL